MSLIKRKLVQKEFIFKRMLYLLLSNLREDITDLFNNRNGVYEKENPRHSIKVISMTKYNLHNWNSILEDLSSFLNKNRFILFNK